MTESELLHPGDDIKPIITFEECKTLVEGLYGIECLSITELIGYDDKNYRVLAGKVLKNEFVERVCPDGYVLKIMNSFESRKLPNVEAQNALMLFLGNNGIACPRPVKNKNGNHYSVQKLLSGEHVVRLMEFIPGSILKQISPSPRLYYQIGKYVASLNTLLQNFNHHGYNAHQSLWMLDNVSQVSQFLIAVPDPKRKQLIEEILNEFKHRVLTARNDLEKGLIHGDFNEFNIVVEETNGEWQMKGILDFGDSHRSCYLFELAITITYMIVLSKDLDVAGYVLAGYSTVRTPTQMEMSLLKVCIASRLVQSLVIGAYTSLKDPENSYVLSTAATGWELLIKLWAEPENKLLERWKTISNNYTNTT